MVESDRVVACLERVIRDCYALLVTANPVYTGPVDDCWFAEWLTDARQALGHHAACCQLLPRFDSAVRDRSAHSIRSGLAILERAQAQVEGNLTELPVPERCPEPTRPTIR
jgi:hypothetical protein